MLAPGVDIRAHLNGTLALCYHGQQLSPRRLPHGRRPTRRTPAATAAITAPERIHAATTRSSMATNNAHRCTPRPKTQGVTSSRTR